MTMYGTVCFDILWSFPFIIFHTGVLRGLCRQCHSQCRGISAQVILNTIEKLGLDCHVDERTRMQNMLERGV